MTRAQIADAIDKAGIYYDPDHPDHIERSKIERLPPSFMTWELQSTPFMADNIVYFEWYDLTAWVFSDTDDGEAEVALSAALREAGLAPTVYRQYSGEIELWVSTFTARTQKD